MIIIPYSADIGGGDWLYIIMIMINIVINIITLVLFQSLYSADIGGGAPLPPDGCCPPGPKGTIINK